MTLSRKEKVAIGGGFLAAGAGILYLLQRTGPASARIAYTGNAAANKVPLPFTPKTFVLFPVAFNHPLVIHYDFASDQGVQVTSGEVVTTIVTQISGLVAGGVLTPNSIDVNGLGAGLNTAGFAYTMLVFP